MISSRLVHRHTVVGPTPESWTRSRTPRPLDLLVGGFCTYLHVKPELTADQRNRSDDVRNQRDKIAAQHSKSMGQLRAKFKDAMRGVPQSEWNTPVNSAKFEKMFQEMLGTPAYQKQREDYACRKTYKRLWKRRNPNATL